MFRAFCLRGLRRRNRPDLLAEAADFRASSKRIGDVPEEDYRRTFNLGVGMVLVVAEKKIGFVSQILRKLREPFYRIGRVVEAVRRRAAQGSSTCEAGHFVVRPRLEFRSHRPECPERDSSIARLGSFFQIGPSAPGLARARELGFPCGSIESAEASIGPNSTRKLLIY